MIVLSKQQYLYMLYLLIVVWFIAVTSLLITPVWDEMGLMHNLKKYPEFLDALRFIWFEFRLYRPLANSLLAIEQWLLPLDYAWQFSRMCNAVMALAAICFLASASQSKLFLSVSKPLSESQRYKLRLLFWLAMLLSPAVLIITTWFANIFDASCLLMIAMGVFAWGRSYFYSAGLLFGLAWFCKEAAVFVMPLLLYLGLVSSVVKTNFLKTTCIYLFMGGLYWLLRSNVVAFGSAEDVHPMSIVTILPTVYGVLGRFLFPGFSYVPTMLGVFLSISAVLAIRKFALLLFFLGLVACASVAYLGCLSGNISPDAPLISPAVFDARLFYIPLALLMFALLVEGLTGPFILLCLAFASSLPTQYLYFRDFQLAYKSYYQLAQTSPSGVVIFASNDSGVQPFFGLLGLKIGAYLPADYILNPQDGSLALSH